MDLDHTIRCRMRAVNRRLFQLGDALSECHIPSDHRKMTLYSASVNLWQWYGMYDLVGFGAREWFDLEYRTHKFMDTSKSQFALEKAS